MQDQETEVKIERDLSAVVLNQLQRTFSPEWLNRLDEVIIFQPLSMNSIIDIANLLLDDLDIQMKELYKIEILYDRCVAKTLGMLGFDPFYGARPLKRVITAYIEDMFVDGILRQKIKTNDRVWVTYRNGSFKILLMKDILALYESRVDKNGKFVLKNGKSVVLNARELERLKGRTTSTRKKRPLVRTSRRTCWGNYRYWRPPSPKSFKARGIKTE